MNPPQKQLIYIRCIIIQTLFRQLLFSLVLPVAFIFMISCNRDSSLTKNKFWDQEPGLYEISKSVILERPLHPVFPQSYGMQGFI